MSTQTIFDEWVTYEKIVANDYMHHREFIALLADHVERKLEQPLAIVDLGCGDAQPVSAILRDFEIRSYVGVDQSRTAIDRARQALTGLGIPFELHCASMPDVLEKIDGPFDVAIASYSLHHLERNEKQRAIHACRRLLRAGGLLGIIDIFLEENETRSDYIRRWQGNAKKAFRALASQETDALLEHVQSCDRPETVACYRQLAEYAGFSKTTSIQQDAERLNRLIVIS